MGVLDDSFQAAHQFRLLDIDFDSALGMTHTENMATLVPELRLAGCMIGAVDIATEDVTAAIAAEGPTGTIHVTIPF